ncbi:MAG TPA: glycosyltransferase family 4 protein, partial [Thermohalobaculum sp.]|nr:glycosyltransferase family 4 protein [Thermohalobaculum sp.]
MSDPSLAVPTDPSAAGGRGKRPLTVLQVVPSLVAGGVEQGTIEVAAAVVQAGGRAIVASAGGPLERRIRAVGAELVLMNAASKNPLDIVQNGWALARLIRDVGADVVHARSRAPAWSALMAARRTATPFVTTFHGAYSERLPLKHFYNSVMARGRPVIAPSRFIGELVAERYGTPPDRIVVIPRGADPRVFSEERVTGHRAVDLAQRWGLLDDTRPVVMLPGRLSRWKGGESVVEAAAILRELRGPDFLVLLVGGETQEGFEATLARRIDALGVGDIVRLCGHCSDMAAALKLASLVVSASIEPEAFGRVAVEAQAMGRPVIATDHGGAQETVVPG